MNEHNPIALEITKIQQHWQQQLSGDTEARLVRLIIKPEEARVYEGFCKLESTPHGQLEEIFVTQLTPFEDEDTFSSALLRDWLTTYDNSAALLREMADKGTPLQWDPAPFRTPAMNVTQPQDRALIDLLRTFRAALPQENAKLVFALIPRTVSDMRNFRSWLGKLLLKGIPPGVKLLVLDHVGKDYLAMHDKQYPGLLRSLYIPLELEKAIQQLATAGNPNDPDIQLRKCLFEMSAALNAKDVKRLHHWGGRALECTQQSGKKGLFATAHIMYAGMLFYFKRDPKLPELLEKGARIAKQGMLQGDVACLPLLIQFYGYQGAFAQIRRRFPEAIDWYLKQAALSTEHNFGQQTINALYQAASLCQRKDSQRYPDVLEQAYQAGKTLSDDDITASLYIYLAKDYYDQAYLKKDTATLREIDERLGKIFGQDWKETAEKSKKSKAKMILQAPNAAPTAPKAETYADQ